MASFGSRVKSFFGFTPDYQLNIPNEIKGTQSVKNIDGYISRVQFQRIKLDVQSWRDAVSEAENAFYPHRVKMQRMYIDTVLNGHVFACMQKRRDLTLLRDFCFYDGDREDDKAAEMLKQPWFFILMECIIEARAYGYSLVNFGDIVNGSLPNLEMIRRWNVSPDRHNITSIVYSISGIDFSQDGSRDSDGNSFFDWVAWIPTPTDNGASKCGYGYLYKVAILEIFLRQNMGFNADFIELYAQPYRVGKTSKSDEVERAKFEEALRNMGSNGYAITDPEDTIEFLETALGGTGWKGYQDFEMRLEKKISKIILGHEDAMSSTPGKLGSTQGVESPANIAMDNVQMVDGRFVESVLNDEVFPKLRNLGMPIPDMKFKFKNDTEEQEIKEQQDLSFVQTATWVNTMKQAGYEVDPKWLTERTGIPLEKVEVAPPSFGSPAFNKTIRNKLKKLYDGHKH